MSTLLYPIDGDCSQDILNKKFQLDKRKDIFWAVENAIGKLGMDIDSFLPFLKSSVSLKCHNFWNSIGMVEGICDQSITVVRDKTNRRKIRFKY